MISMIGFSANYVLAELYVSELFPTQIRANLLGLTNMVMRIAPLFVTTLRKTLGYLINMTFIITGAISFFVVYLFMEETLFKKQIDFVYEDINEDNQKDMKTNFINSIK